MLSLEQCRRILGTDCQMPDAALKRLRDDLYALADITVVAFMQRGRRDENMEEGKRLANEELSAKERD
jgi:hypothetical protein